MQDICHKFIYTMYIAIHTVFSKNLVLYNLLTTYMPSALISILYMELNVFLSHIIFFLNLKNLVIYVVNYPFLMEKIYRIS